MREVEMPDPFTKRDDPLRGVWPTFWEAWRSVLRHFGSILERGIRRRGDPGAAATGAPERTDDDGD